jgi:hypothetical protein
MRWLRLAIARLLGSPTPSMEVTPVQQTPIAGPVSPGRTTKTGKEDSVADTNRRPRHASPAVKAKSARVRRGTMAQSSAQEQAPAQLPTGLQSGAGGHKRATTASQPASPSPTRKPSVAQQTTAESSPKPAQKPAPTTSGNRGKPRPTPARRTRQHAK